MGSFSNKFSSPGFASGVAKLLIPKSDEESYNEIFDVSAYSDYTLLVEFKGKLRFVYLHFNLSNAQIRLKVDGHWLREQVYSPYNVVGRTGFDSGWVYKPNYSSLFICRKKLEIWGKQYSTTPSSVRIYANYFEVG